MIPLIAWLLADLLVPPGLGVLVALKNIPAGIVVFALLQLFFRARRRCSCARKRARAWRSAGSSDRHGLRAVRRVFRRCTAMVFMQ